MKRQNITKEQYVRSNKIMMINSNQIGENK